MEGTAQVIAPVQITVFVPFLLTFPLQGPVFMIVLDVVELGCLRGADAQSPDCTVDERGTLIEFQSRVVANDAGLEFFKAFDEFAFGSIDDGILFVSAPGTAAKHDRFIARFDAPYENRSFFVGRSPSVDPPDGFAACR